MTDYFKSKYCKFDDSKNIICTLCPNECVFKKDGVVGACSVRKRIGDMLASLSYGRNVGFSIDPIEKKPLYHFYPNADIFSFGTFGCNLSCKFCQNSNLSNPKNYNENEISLVLPKDILSYVEKNNIKLVAFTYNEPTVFAEFVIETSKILKENGIKTVAVSNGYISKEARKDFYENIDAVNIDLKSFNKDFYKNICGGKLNSILDTIEYVASKKDTWLEVTNLIIPGENDSLEEIGKMGEFFIKNFGNSIPFHFSAFFPSYKMMDKEPTSLDTLIEARNIFISLGFKYVYIGNVRNNEVSSSYCYNCKKKVIDRSGYLVENNLVYKEGKAYCPNCNFEFDGVF